jgi:Family of unknown function (DUF5677)
MDTETQKAMNYAERLYHAALALMATAKVDISTRWNRDPKVLAVTIFGRTLSIYKAALILLHENQIIEARMLGRPLFENLLWLAALVEHKDAFVAEMLDDDALNRRSLGQTTMKVSVRHGADPNSENSMTLRNILREIAKAYADPKKLYADKVAAMGKLEIHYVDYARLSLDSLHCSITALGRHITKEAEGNDHTIVTLNVEPRVTDNERLGTVLLLCRSLMGSGYAVHDMVGPVNGFGAFVLMVDEFEANGWTSRT